MPTSADSQQATPYLAGNRFFYGGLIILVIGLILMWWNGSRFGVHKTFAISAFVIVVIGIGLTMYGSDKGDIFKK